MDIYTFLNCVSKSDNINDYKPAVLINSAHELTNENTLPNEDMILLQLLQNIITLAEDYSKKTCVFEPYVSFNHSRSFAPCDMTEQDWETLSKIEVDNLPLAIKARISDFLWDQRKKHQMGITAVKSYLQLYGRLWNTDHWPRCFDMIQRAICIAAQLNKGGPEYISCIDAITNGIKKTQGKDASYLSFKLFCLLRDHSKITDPELICCATEMLNTARTNMNIEKSDMATRLLYSLMKANGKESKGNEYMAMLAKYYASLANDPYDVPLRRVDHLKKAIHIYNEIHDKQKAEECKRALEMLQPLISQNLHLFQNSLDVTEYRKHVLEITDKQNSVRDYIYTLAGCCIIRTKEELFNELKNDKSLPMEPLFSTIIVDGEGRQTYQLPSLDLNNLSITSQAVREHMWNKAAAIQELFGSTVLFWIVDEMNRHFEYRKEDFDFLVRDNGIIPSGREDIIRTGLYLGLKGDFYAALHILIPQIENVFRYIASMCGAIVYTLEDDNSSQAKTLKSIFSLPELVDAYDENVLFCLEGLLDEKAGSNLRNKIAHGLIDSKEANGGIGLYCIALIIKILLWTVAIEKKEE